MPSRLIDLSHVIEVGMVTYKGLPAPLICDHLSRIASRPFYDAGTEFQIGRIEMVGNTGTYIDAPFHRFEDGHDVAGFALDQVAGVPGVLIDATPIAGPAIGPEAFDGRPLTGRAVLVRTDWDRHWRTDAYFEGHPFLTEAAAARLVREGAALVGIDSHNIDDTRSRLRPVHTLLLGAGLPIVEHMTNLAALPTDGFAFTAAPPKVKGMGTFPVRAFARIEEPETDG